MNKSKQKGTAFESLVVLFLRAAGFKWVERRVLGGAQDKGDIAGLPWVLECKAEKSIDLAGYMKEAQVEAANAGTDLYAAIVKRRNKSVADSYVVMPLSVFVKVLHETPALR